MLLKLRSLLALCKCFRLLHLLCMYRCIHRLLCLTYKFFWCQLVMFWIFILMSLRDVQCVPIEVPQNSHTHTHNRLMALSPGLPGWASTRKVKPIWILLKQETVSGVGISWAICKSAPRSRQITTPAPHHSVFLQAGCPSCRPTNSVKALKA